MKKINIIVYSTNDKFISIPILFEVLNKLPNNINVDLFLDNPNFFRKLKILLVFILFSPLKHFRFIYKKKNLEYFNELKNVKLINKPSKKYNCGFLINYTKKIKLKNYEIFNFHLGNFINQRGSFGYFFKFKYKWSKMDLTFHKIDKNWDKGQIIKKKTINVKDLSAIQICFLYKKNINFIHKCMLAVISCNQKYLIPRYGKLNTTPSYFEIFCIYFKNLLKI